MAVAVCLAALLMPLASELTDADDGYYYYTITNSTGSDGVISVTVTDGDNKETDPIASDKDSDGSYTSTSTTNVGSWGFDPDTGLGPFNSFYAAFDPYHDNALVGILDPYDLTRLIDGCSIEGQSYNIMWVLPTVYWKANDDGSLTLTDDPSGGTAYAHTIYDDDGEHVYGYIAYGVYEASVQDVDGTDVLTSTSGQKPSGGYTREQFRDYANAQDVVVDSSASTTGHAMLWNFYQYELYKYCCVAAMASWDSQGVAGYGYSYYDESNLSNTTGLLNGAGPYAGNTANYTDSVKVFIENAWGSLQEFVDGIIIEYGIYMYVDQWYSPTDSTTTSAYVSEFTVSLLSGGYGSAPSTTGAIWGYPTAEKGTASSGLYDYYNDTGAGDGVVSVGGGAYFGYFYGAGANGISCMEAEWDITGDYAHSGDVGTRLAFVFDVGNMTATLSFDADGGSVLGSQSQTFTIDSGAEFTLSESPTRDGYEFLGWTRYAGSTEVNYAAGDTVKIWSDTTLYAVWYSDGGDGGSGGGTGTTGPVHSFTVYYDANGGTGAPDTQRYTTSSTSATMRIPSTEPTRSGYTFLGWSTDAGATSAEYGAGDSIQLTSDGSFSTSVTLYAVWGAGSSSGSGSGSGDTGDGGSRSGSGTSGGSDGGDSDWWVWALIIVVIIILVAISGYLGYRARGKS